MGDEYNRRKMGLRQPRATQPAAPQPQEAQSDESRMDPLAAAPPPAGPSPDVDRGRAGGWVNLGEHFGLNKDQAAGMTERVVGGAERKARAAKSAISRTRDYNSAGYGGGENQSLADLDNLGADVRSGARDVRMAGSDTGRMALLDKEYGPTGAYASGMDSFLVGQQGGDRIADLDKQYGGLEEEFLGAEQQGVELREQRRVLAEQGRTEQAAIDAAEKKRRGMGTPFRPSPHQNISGTAGTGGGRPNDLSDAQLSAMGYPHDPAPGESYAHFSARLEARRR